MYDMFFVVFYMFHFCECKVKLHKNEKKVYSFLICENIAFSEFIAK